MARKRDEGWKDYVPERLREDLKKLPSGLLEHCARSAQVARTIAERFAYDPDKAEATVLIHDVARGMGDRELLEAAGRFGISPNDVERAEPILLHGRVGAEMLRREYGVTDEEMLGAVACHTTGRRGMLLLDKVLFLADQLDPEKVQRQPELAKVARLAESDLDRAVLARLDFQLTTFIEKGLLIHPTMVEVRNDLLIISMRRASC